jgi:hypothetical protein
MGNHIITFIIRMAGDRHRQKVAQSEYLFLLALKIVIGLSDSIGLVVLVQDKTMLGMPLQDEID